MKQSAHQKVVVLGASGFIGRNLIQVLADSDRQLICVGRHPPNEPLVDAKFIDCDIAHPSEALLEAIDGAVVYHLAATTRPSPDTAHAAAELVDNTAATVMLLEAAKGLKCRWVFSSSGGTVYGNCDCRKIDEGQRCRPISAYGVSKLATEYYFHLYAALHATEFVVARISNPFGQHQSADSGQGLIAVLYDRIARQIPIEIWGDGENVRDFIHVNDVVRALLLLAEAGFSGETFNVGSGHGTTVNELINRIAADVGRDPIVRHKPARAIDVRRNVLNVDKAEQRLGWRPKITLEEGLFMTGGDFLASKEQ